MNAAVKKAIRTCGVDGCERKHLAKGLCNLHYRRQRTHGNPGTASPQRLRGEPAAVKLTAYSMPAADGSGCRLWTGAKDSNGYGQIRLDGRQRLAHRVAWAEVYGAIPEGAQVDHVCANRACVNPGHLQLVTHEQNLRLRNFRSGSFASKQTAMAAFIRLGVLEGLRILTTDGMSLEAAAAAAALDKAQASIEEAA